MPPIDPTQLQTLTGMDLMDLAEEFASSDDVNDHRALLIAMKSGGFLDRLDPDEAYEGMPMDLALARIIRTLADNPVSSAHTVLLEMTTDPPFVSRWQCNELLILALADLRPAPQKAVDYWRHHSLPEALHRHTTMQAVCRNASAPAMPVLHDNLANPLQDQQERIAWMRDPVLQNRCEPEILDTCRKLLTETLQPDLRANLVEGLYDYQPLTWYSACSPPQPPDADEWTQLAKDRYWELGTLIVNAPDIPDRLKQLVENVIEPLRPK